MSAGRASDGSTARHDSAVLQAQGVVKHVGVGRARQRLLCGIDLEVGRGEMVAVLGRSGSGKSTLLHLLGGLDRPDAGHIRVAGQELSGASRRRLDSLRLRHIGFVFQSFALIEELTGRENVLLAARLPGAPRGGARRAGDLIARLGLEDVADRRPHELSGGEQQRIAIARALVNDPALVLADEATGNLDVSTGAIVLALLTELAAEGRAVVLVTHEPKVAEAAGRVAHLIDGHLSGEPDPCR